jgi:hypothetical protein
VNTPRPQTAHPDEVPASRRAPDPVRTWPGLSGEAKLAWQDLLEMAAGDLATPVRTTPAQLGAAQGTSDAAGRRALAALERARLIRIVDRYKGAWTIQITPRMRHDAPDAARHPPPQLPLDLDPPIDDTAEQPPTSGDGSATLPPPHINDHSARASKIKLTISSALAPDLDYALPAGGSVAQPQRFRRDDIRRADSGAHLIEAREAIHAALSDAMTRHEAAADETVKRIAAQITAELRDETLWPATAIRAAELVQGGLLPRHELRAIVDRVRATAAKGNIKTTPAQLFHAALKNRCRALDIPW